MNGKMGREWRLPGLLYVDDLVLCDERIDGFIQWFSHVERMENKRIVKRVHVGECADSHSVFRLQKRWVDTMKDCLRKKRFGCQASKENGAG